MKRNEGPAPRRRTKKRNKTQVPEIRKILVRQDETNLEESSLLRLNLARVSSEPIRAASQEQQKQGHSGVFSRFAGIALCGALLLVTLVWCLGLGITSGVTEHSVVISEVMTQNVCSICDADGNFYDYIELTNTSDVQVSLHGMGLTDSAVGSARYVFEDTVLAPGESILLFCTDPLPFSLKSSGDEVIRLLDANGNTVASMQTVAMQPNEALVYDGEIYQVTDRISPGFANGEMGYLQYLTAKKNEEPSLVISEVATRNMTLMGTDAQCIELENISSSPIELSDYALSDDENDLLRFVLPQGTLQAGECVVYTFGDASQDAEFSFSSKESVYLSDLRGVVQCQAPVCTQDNTTLILEDDAYVQADAVSLGFSNDEQGAQDYLAAYPIDGVIISEIVADNHSYFVNGTYLDYIELYNAGDTAADLSQYSLSDVADEPNVAPLLDVVLQPGAYIVFAADGDLAFDDYDPQSCILPFGLSKEGEALTLYHDGTPVDYVSFPEAGRDASYGRVDGVQMCSYLASPSPNAANTKAQNVCAAPRASVQGGVYDDVESVTVSLWGEGEIRYTLDSTEPTATSPLYTDALVLDETTVVRARCYVDGMAPGEVFTATYLINEGHTMDVACLVSDPSGLFSQGYGIYATGYNAAPESPHFGANYWNRWEREAVVSLYSEDGGFTSPCGVRIFGGFSRSFDQKSLSILFRSEYGAGELNYPLFGEDGLDSYEAFVFRSTGQDVYRAHMRDALMTTMYDDLLGQTTSQDSRPVVLYINGEYWGVYFIREKINEHFIAGKCNVDSDTVTILFQKGYGNADFQSIVNYARTHDLSQQEHFDYVASRVNLESYTNYLIAQMYSGNFDIGNVRYFSSPQYDNGRWNWILYDVDWTMSSPNTNSVRTMLSSNIVYSADLINALLKNPAFKDQFLREFARQLNEVWDEDTVNRYVDEFVAQLVPEMQRECDRWGWRYTTWENQVEQIRDFAHVRPSNLYDYVKSYFGLSDSQMAEYGFTR